MLVLSLNTFNCVWIRARVSCPLKCFSMSCVPLGKKGVKGRKGERAEAAERNKVRNKREKGLFQKDEIEYKYCISFPGDV
jgi:hypothetical protein